MSRQYQTEAGDRAIEQMRQSVQEIEDAAFDLAIDAVANADRWSLGQRMMVQDAYGDFVRVAEAQAEIRKLQR
jgi:hypothetical protein